MGRVEILWGEQAYTHPGNLLETLYYGEPPGFTVLRQAKSSGAVPLFFKKEFFNGKNI